MKKTIETKLENYKVSVDENEVATLFDNKPGNDVSTNTNIKVTDKRVYITTATKKEKSKCIVSIDEIDAVTYLDKKKRKHSLALAVVGIIILFVGAALIAISFKKPGIIRIIGGAVGGLGLIVFVFGLIIARYHHFCTLIIGSTSSQIEVDVGEIKSASIASLQKIIFQTKEENKNVGFINPNI